MLRVEGVRKSFGDHLVLDGIDLHVERGEVVCLIGASGSGKSTLLRCVDLLELTDDGDIHLGDLELTDPAIDENAARSRIAMVFQSFNLFPHLTVMQNLTIGPRRVKGVAKSRAQSRALELLTRVGLESKAHAFPDSLSGGQQQRVALVRAVAMDPELLLLDEVTSALDPLLVGEVLDVVRELKNEGRTIVMATHEMSFARECADRIVFLADGRIVESGPPEQLFTAPRDPRTRAFLERHMA
ncbi:amino acid ABC transporter ATP-binding protein [Aeromicrobium duanguangcaii]|uniref:Amino acid ABC transporter ATP-binding protein n=1 Tax=Aeromicrobium duanguangcaii TaxID=2968086 RepID=A0ABY5KDP5_9ACTN|nr:amino acid ABC transporter ATP-binding protein [Aeromicrobium duanguangcaii]MCD9154494.1 amino acid ABC transporter ATP-binding protein [Aeromicrobium duanguangcaii]MCL3838242.1 amino acid ABC transporter ATP-binding protein [Aeromicrobium duanguangcaii]UUI68450.1 amino acid ABC transporter ATP-binding protein [Aeromicrobium duanguangcaii]